ncbi:helix-turn-helix domain-containing protein [Actinoplanes sp. L3-i22]|uniref:helix-turn-helix domain-containing protein n=1 Tax=Actinoplanes sp. L3-i22 TaxID=2836373 RepID=UPI001C744906|nr:helix-turn-helix transcriptional regulator [Actinoplanes sp. L3-i22]BCY09225.1 transcriptional regulator [Actinoplanes sp. L3-i22]
MTDTSGGRAAQAEIGEFLRSRRARITPEQAGLPQRAGSRRVPGLRREEVARLAGVSVDYYIRLERGRAANASEAVLSAVARALSLNDLERKHLFTLAAPGRSRSRPRPLPRQQVRPGLRRLLDALTDTPAIVLGHRTDVLAVNDLGRALFTDFDALPRRDRNMARFVFLDEAARGLYVDWDDAARGMVATLHLHAGAYPYDPLLAELIGELSVRDDDFRRWWADHDVYQRTHGTKRYHHPLVGDLVLGYEAVMLADDPEQLLGLITAERGSPSEDALRLLATLEAAASALPG